MYERKDSTSEPNDITDETETSSIMRIKKEDPDKKPNYNASIKSEQPDTVLYLREINKYPDTSTLFVDFFFPTLFSLLSLFFSLFYSSCLVYTCHHPLRFHLLQSL